MTKFNIFDKYTSAESGEEYYFYNPISNTESGLFYKAGGGCHIHELPYSSMVKVMNDNEGYTIKYDCVEYKVSKDIKERYDAIIQEARDYEATH